MLRPSLAAVSLSALCLFTPLVADNAVSASASASDASLSTTDWTQLKAHPRLFATADGWTRLRAQLATDPVSARLFSFLRADADALLDKPPVALVKEGRRLLEPVRAAQGRIFRLALVARLTGDARYVRRATAEMLHLAVAPDWNPSHFLDAAEASLALGTGYDWLHDELSPADRTLIADAIISKALLPSFNEPSGKPFWWVKGDNNWNQVCHGGLTAGALAIAERNPDLARRVVGRAVANLHHSAGAYAPDGAYPEGPMYWGYGTTFHIVLIEALRTALGTTADLDAFPGFLPSADYIRHVTTPAGKFYAYSDGGSRRGFTPALFWFARRLQRADLIQTDLDQLRTATLNPAGDRFAPFALLWRDPALPAASSSGATSWFARGPNPLGIHRSAWNDPRAAYLAIKGGSPSINHAHMDAGSFLIEADGVTWAADIGAQDYNSLESAGIKNLFDSRQTSARWTVFRLGAESHNILRFDDQPQIAKASAIPGRHRETGESPFTQFDLSPLYAGQIARIVRGASLHPGRRIVLQDEWTALPAKPVNVTWQWLTYADAVIDGSCITLRQNNETLTLAIQSPADARLEIEDMSAPRAAYDAPNPKLKRIRIHARSGAGETGRITILVTPSAPATGQSPLEIKAMADW